jgi:predicted TIM-barrel fold metal-dependent hydrolase
MIIDCHCHAGKGDGLTGPWDTAAPLARYLRRAAEAGIGRTVLFAAFHSDYAVANEAVSRIVRMQPDRFFGFAFVHAVNDRGRVLQLVQRAVEQFGFVGIKLHRYDAPITREICEAARAFSLPVLFDVMGEVSVCELLAQEYPDVNFIIPHLGSFADDWKAQVAFIDHLVRHPNIYTDTAGVRRFDVLGDAVRRAGAGKILFGSDGPWLHPGLELAKVRALKLSSRDEAMVLRGNIARLIRPVGARGRSVSGPPASDRPGAATEGALRGDPWQPQAFIA